MAAADTEPLASEMAIFEAVHMKNFRRFEDCTVELEKVTILAGKNNTGKSSVIHALTLWRFCHFVCFSEGEYHDKQYVGANDILAQMNIPTMKWLWHKEDQPLTVGVKLRNVDSVIAFELSSPNGRVNITPLLNVFPVGIVIPEIIFIPSQFQIVNNEVINQIGTMAYPDLKKSIVDLNAAKLIRNMIYHLDQEGKDSLQNVLHDFFGISGLDFEFGPGGLRTDDRLYLTSQDGKLEILQYGLGLQSIVILFSILLFVVRRISSGSRVILCLDEPNAHLHSELIKRLGDFLKNDETYTSQTIWATHAAELLVHKDNVALISFDGGPPRRVYHPQGILRNLGTDLLMTSLGYIVPTKIILVENLSDSKIIRAWAKTLFSADYEQFKSKAVFVALGTRFAVEATISNFITDLAGSVMGGVAKFFCIMDRDYRTQVILQQERDKLEKIAAQKQFKMDFNVWPRVEIENYLIEPEIIVRLAAALNVTSPPTKEEVREQILAGLPKAKCRLAKESSNHYFAHRSDGYDEFIDRLMMEIQSVDADRAIDLVDAKDILKFCKLKDKQRLLAQTMCEAEIHADVKVIIRKLRHFLLLDP